MVEFNIDLYEITMRYIVPGMIILAILGVLIYHLGSENVFGQIGRIAFSNGMKLP